ncbi:MAG: hypothetical protein IJR58_06280 [Lachnospiraceae bacterium]|nr:hypothetical protein [Lachnospiraceae bacterium]
MSKKREPVAIKGVKNGIVLQLDDAMPYTELRTIIAEKFFDAASFLGAEKIGLSIEGRTLSEDEEEDVLNIIDANTDVTVVCVLHEDAEKEEDMVRYIGVVDPATAFAHRSKELTNQEKFYEYQLENKKKRLEIQKVELGEIKKQLGCGVARVHQRSVKATETIFSEHGIVIFGNVEPGGCVKAAGSVIVLGALMGKVAVGTTGDTSAIVVALDFFPEEIQIADRIENYAGEHNIFKKHAFKRNRAKERKNVEVAYLSGKKIIRTTYSASLFAQDDEEDEYEDS